MKKLQILTLAGFLFVGKVFAQQELDPYSIPAGAPIFHRNLDDTKERLAGQQHPGAAGQKVATSNFAIIESQSTMTAHNMDAQWLTVVTGMGHTGSILPQSTLNSTAFFASTDALIVSSGIIALSPTAVVTILQFMQTGKSVYIQGEYQTTYTTNQAFQTVVNATGGTLALGGTISGDLSPCTILNLYATTPNSVPTIGYHWYGATASGCNNIEYFMRYSGNNLGYIYCPTNAGWGDVIQNTDQDWVRVGTSYPLMRNIVYGLLSGNACSVVCGTVLTENAISLLASEMGANAVKLSWTISNIVQDGKFRIARNGVFVGELPVSTLGQVDFDFVDSNAPSGPLEYQVLHLGLDGVETMQASVSLLHGDGAPRLRVASEQAGFRIWLDNALGAKDFTLTSAEGRHLSLSVADLLSAQGEFVAMSQFPSGIYVVEVTPLSATSIRKKVGWQR